MTIPFYVIKTNVLTRKSAYSIMVPQYLTSADIILHKFHGIMIVKYWCNL